MKELTLQSPKQSPSVSNTSQQDCEELTTEVEDLKGEHILKIGKGVAEYPGLQIISENNSVTLSKANNIKLKAFVQKIGATYPSTESYRPFLEFICHLVPFFRFRKLHIQSFWDAVKNNAAPNNSKKLRIDINYWTFMPYQQDLRIWDDLPTPADPYIEVCTDACYTGLGGWYLCDGKKVKMRGKWTVDNLKLCTEKGKLDISNLEMLAILKVLEKFCDDLTGKTILIRCDNYTVVNALSKKSRSTKWFDRKAEYIWHWYCNRNIKLYIKHIKSKFNTLADALSRQG